MTGEASSRFQRCSKSLYDFVAYLSSNHLTEIVTSQCFSNKRIYPLLHLPFSVSTHLHILNLVSTRSSTVTPAARSSTSVRNPPQQNTQSDTTFAALLVQQSQLLQRMEQRLANLEARDQLLACAAATSAMTPPMAAPIAPAATSAMTPPMRAPVAPAATHTYTDDPCQPIKLEIPKFDGKIAESYIISFERYCRILQLKTDEDILLAVGIAMTGKATLWWFFFFFFFLKSLNPAFGNRHGRGADTYPDPRC